MESLKDLIEAYSAAGLSAVLVPFESPAGRRAPETRTRPSADRRLVERNTGEIGILRNIRPSPIASRGRPQTVDTPRRAHRFPCGRLKATNLCPAFSRKIVFLACYGPRAAPRKISIAKSKNAMISKRLIGSFITSLAVTHSAKRLGTQRVIAALHRSSASIVKVFQDSFLPRQPPKPSLAEIVLRRTSENRCFQLQREVYSD
jgi:hypothetical protein